MKPQLNRTLDRSMSILAALVLAIALMAPQAFGATTDTDAGDQIDNVATINYQVGGVDQPAEDSNTASFVVDHKVRPVAANSADDNAVPSGVNEVLTYTVTNDGNTDATTSAVLEIQLTALQGVDGTEDDFDVVANSIRIYLETDTVAGFDGTDTEITNYATSTFGTIDLERDDSATVYLVANMPATPTNGQTALVHLVATAWDGAAALAEDTNGDDPAAMEVVWADDAGTAPAIDVAVNGLHSASATYTIVTATIGVTKSSTVQADPFGNVFPNAYRVPRAQVRYLIEIENTGAVAADSIVMLDTIPGGTAYIVGSEATSLAGVTVEYSNNNRTSWVYSPSGPGEDTAITDIRFTLTGSVATGATETIEFDVFIQ